MELKMNPEINRKQVLNLYTSVGWTAYTDNLDALMMGLENSFVIAAYEQETLVGLVRGVTDTSTILYVQDILVNPNHQRQGIGQMLLTNLLKEFSQIGQVILLTDDEEKTKSFYQSLKFKTAEDSFVKCFVLDRRY